MASVAKFCFPSYWQNSRLLDCKYAPHKTWVYQSHWNSCLLGWLTRSLKDTQNAVLLSLHCHTVYTLSSPHKTQIRVTVITRAHTNAMQIHRSDSRCSHRTWMAVASLPLQDLTKLGYRHSWTFTPHLIQWLPSTRWIHPHPQNHLEVLWSHWHRSRWWWSSSVGRWVERSRDAGQVTGSSTQSSSHTCIGRETIMRGSF